MKNKWNKRDTQDCAEMANDITTLWEGDSFAMARRNHLLGEDSPSLIDALSMAKSVRYLLYHEVTTVDPDISSTIESCERLHLTMSMPMQLFDHGEVAGDQQLCIIAVREEQRILFQCVIARDHRRGKEEFHIVTYEPGAWVGQLIKAAIDYGVAAY